MNESFPALMVVRTGQKEEIRREHSKKSSRVERTCHKSKQVIWLYYFTGELLDLKHGSLLASKLELTTVFLIALVKAVRGSVTLPAAWDALPIATHEVSRNVTFGGEVIPREQLAL